MRISDWSSDVCSSDLKVEGAQPRRHELALDAQQQHRHVVELEAQRHNEQRPEHRGVDGRPVEAQNAGRLVQGRSEEHTSELQSLMRISYAVFCLKKKKNR